MQIAKVANEGGGLTGSVREDTKALLKAYLRSWSVGHSEAGAGNRLEALKGRWKGFYSIRINDQWRFVFRFESGNASYVRVVDYY